MLSIFNLSSTLALNPAGPLRIRTIAPYNLVVDSNVESPSSYAPGAVYIGVEICNDGVTDLTDLYVKTGDFQASTPGVFPSRSHAPLVGTFSLTLESGASGTSDAVRYISRLGAGECLVQYWLVSYPNLDNNGDAVTVGNGPDDDLWLNYDVWATAKNGASNLTADVRDTFWMRSEISAMANKIWPNGPNKVPDVYLNAIQEAFGWSIETASGGASPYPGERFTLQGIWYDLGNISQGLDNNGDFVPDGNVLMQPVGDPSLYDSDCFRLIGAHGLIIVKLKSGGEFLIPFENDLYFENIPENNGAVGIVFYDYIALNGPCQSALTPFQEAASGQDNEKFNGDFGVEVPLIISHTPTVDLEKTVSPTTVSSLPANLTYSIAFSNAGPIAIGEPLQSYPLVVQDAVPAGTSYVAGSATASNALPAGVTAYNVFFSTDGGSTWVQAEPAPASAVTNIQWWLDSKMAAGTSGTVQFQVTVPTTYPGALVENVAGLSFGNTLPFATDNAVSFLPGPNNVGDLVWSDNGGTSGTQGDGIKNGNETGLANVTTWLYYDWDGDGALDESDILFSTGATNASGAYLFSNLPDGKYIVAVDDSDPDLPTGYSSTTPTIFAVNLDPTHATSGAVSVLTADFGFSPALKIEKDLLSASPAYEGQQVTFGIDLKNMLGGNTSSCNETVDYGIAWAPSNYYVSGSVKYSNPANVAGAPNGTEALASTPWENTASPSAILYGDEWNITPCGNLTKVEAVFKIRLDGNVTDDGARVQVVDAVNNNNGGQPTVTAAGLNAANNSGGLLFVDVTSNNGANMLSWSTWDNNPVGEIRIGLLPTRSGGNTSTWDGRNLYLDAVGLRFTSDNATCNFTGSSAPACLTCSGVAADPAETLWNVPLTDTYDATKLEFVSASEIPTSTTPAGTLAWSNVGPICPGETKHITVTFKAKAPTTSGETTINTATSSGATFYNGNPANSATDNASVTLNATGSIGNYVWNDLDADGVQDGSEVGIPNVKVTLVSSVNLIIDGVLYAAGTSIVTYTDASGQYLFTGLLDGTYSVAIDPASIPGSETQTYDPDGTRNNTTSVTIASANDVLTADFGYRIPNTITGNIFHDNNGNSVQNTGENALASVTVWLYTSANVLSQTTTTDASGNFLFTNVANGSYYISVNTASLPAGSTWTNTRDPEGTPGNNRSNNISVTGGNIYAGYTFGYHCTGAYTLSGTIYADWNANATLDASSEEGFPSRTVFLYEDADGDQQVDVSSDALIANTTTNSTGFYSFSNLPPGNFTVAISSPSGNYAPTQDYNETGLCSTCDGLGGIAITSANVSNVNFGFLPSGTAQLGDYVWRDANGDGLQAGLSETGIPNMTVYLYADLNNDGTYVLTDSTTTDAAGLYLFDELPNGNFRVSISLSDPDLPTDAVGVDFSATTPTFFNAVISGGTVTQLGGSACTNCSLNADFGFAQLGAIGDIVFWDANQNGAFDWSEAGVAGVTVRLINPATNTVVATTTTSDGTGGNPVGWYLFTGLSPDSYRVEVVSSSGPIAGAVQTADPNSDGILCNDPQLSALGYPACNNAYTFSVGYGTNFQGADFGYLPTGVLGDFVWFDQDGDGLQDTGEPGLAFVAIALTNQTSVTIGGTTYAPGTYSVSETTDPDGFYSFSNLPNGTWALTVTPPAGMSATSGAQSVGANATNVVISGGSVTSVGGTACAACDLKVDFGYEFDGTYALSGTICLDNNAAPDGICGGTDDTQLEGITVYLYNDAGDYLGSTQTGTGGAYQFNNLVADVYYVVVGTSTAPLDLAELSTELGDTPATSIVENANSVYQIVPVNATTAAGATSATTVESVDFAFDLPFDLDFGDLPDGYTTLFSDNGPRHIVPLSPVLYLGAGVDSESNGAPNANASGDGSDEDGVAFVAPENWAIGPAGGSVQVAVHGTGYLVGWIDFDQDGSLAGDMVVSQAVATGTTSIGFTVPTDAVINSNSIWYVRFRLFPEAPIFPEFSYMGLPFGTSTAQQSGEVEDYVVYRTACPTPDCVPVRITTLD